MLEEQLIEEFRQRLLAETEDELKGNADGNGLAVDAALAEVILGDLEEAGALADHEPCAYEDNAGSGRCRIIAYSFPDDSTRLELITARFVPPSAADHLSAKDLSQLAGRAARFFGYAANGDLDRFRTSDSAFNAAHAINTNLSRIEEVRVNILTNAYIRDRSVADIKVADRRVEFSVWDLERLYRASGEQVTRDRIEVDFLKLMGAPISALEMRPPPSEYQTFLLVLPGDLICKLYDQFGPRLFEFNVRSFLQARGQVNKGLRDTLKTEPERFLAYNNGLTATADVIDAGTLNGETVLYRLKGLQIVNGAQTTASIHRAKKIDKIDVSRVAVSMKLTRVASDKLSEFIPLIAKYANTQNPVQLADLSANNAFHISLERLSEQIWSPGEEYRWFFERARGAYEVARLRAGTTAAKRRLFDQECPKANKFTKTDLAKVWMSWWGKPEVVSRGAQKNFSAFMLEIADRTPITWSPDEQFYRQTIALILLFKGCQFAVRRSTLQSYGANVVAFMMAKLKAQFGEQLSLDEIWTHQALSPQLFALLLNWAPLLHQSIVRGAGSRNVTEFAKKEECWEKIKVAILPIPQSLPPEIKPNDEGVQSLARDGDDNELIARCMKLDGKDWAVVVAWAAASTTVAEFDRKVAHTLLGYALNNWEHQPSEKQARIASRVLDAARRAGILLEAA